MKPNMTSIEKLRFAQAIFFARIEGLNREARKTADVIFEFSQVAKGQQLDSDRKIDEGWEE